MAEFSDSQSEAPNMADLLEYFEARSRSLDDEGHPILDASTLQFISLIRFNGIPILPPVLTQNKREEMQSYRHAAVKLENQTRAKRREDMHTKVQSIVAGVEERRAAKQASKSSNKTSPSGAVRKPESKRSSETLTRLSGTKSFIESGKSVPPEIVINMPNSKTMDKQSDKQKSAKASTSSPVSNSSSKSKPSNYKSLGKVGVLNKQKSLSSQHLDRTSNLLNQSKEEMDKISPKRHSSKGLLPHPPSGRPPSRGNNMRQSASTPDLRNIDINVETDDLRKPLPSRSLSPKGGRPQTGVVDLDSPKEKVAERKNSSEPLKSARGKSDKAKQSTISKEPINLKKDARTKLEESKSKVSNSTSPAKDSKNQTLHNPLETLEKELVRQEEAEKSQASIHSKQNVRADLDPIQAAAAELFPYPITEEEALATLDSLQADFASLEQMDSLPNDYNGIPLNSVKEQQIIHMLTKLSRALNIEDTLASTTSSNASQLQQNKDFKQEQGASGSYNKNVTSGAMKGGQGSGEPHEPTELYDDGSINVTNDSSLTGPSSGSVVNSSRGRMSPTSSSILSSASSVGASRSRMSPKSLKNTVHFSSFVTEISTSASQSYEDKISIRKLDVTPKNSENFEETESVESKNENSSRSGLGPGTSQQSGSLLNKVALSPSIDSSSGSPREHHSQSFNQSVISQDGDLNTSDKENEFSPSVQNSSNESYQNSRSSRNQHVLNVYTAHIPEGPIGENHPAVVKASVKSDNSETSTLKGSQERVLTEENLSRYSKLLETQCYYNTGSKDLDIYTHGTNSSTSSMQEEITRSYILQQQKPERDWSDIRSIKKKQEPSSTSSEGITNVLQPVLPHNFQNSLNINRSMLEDEEQIRSRLQRVLLEDSDEDSSIEHNDNSGDVLNTVPTVKEDSDSEGDIDINEPEKDLATVSQDQNEEPFHKLQKLNLEVGKDEDKEVDTATFEPVKDTGNHEKYRNETEKDTVEIKVVDVQPEVEEVEEEEEGKAEHIQKYLTHVHEQSMQNEEEPDDIVTDDVKTDDNFDIASLIHSFTATLQSMNHLSQEDLFRIQAEQFELLQKKLIEQQRAQLEELFVTQRREQMALEKEIEGYQININDNIETIPLPDTERVRLSGSIPDPSPAWQYTNQPHAQNPQQVFNPLPNPTLSPPFPIQPVATIPYQPNMNSSMMSHNTSYSTIPYSDIHSGLPFQQGQGHYFQGHRPVEPNPGPGMMPPSSQTVSAKLNEEVPRRVTKKKPVMPQTVTSSNPYIYPSSPSLSRNPADRDDESDVSGFVRATPKQLVFSNQSTPVPVPKVSTHRPVMHSPAKRPSQAWNVGKPVIPEKVFDPNMKTKFDRISATVKGYLTRRLLKTHKVQEIIKTINDTRNFAFSFQSETPIKEGTYSREDRGLLERIVAQLQAALLDVHEIFFEMPVSERMAIISSSRLKERDMYLRDSTRKSYPSVTQSQPKLSKATLKALERKKKAQLAEEAVFGSTEFRPKSAPPATSSPHPSMDIRALRPLQGQISPIRPDSQITVREMKERPKSAADKVKVKTVGTNNKTKKMSGTKTTKPGTAATQSKQQKNVVQHPKSKKSDKAWR